MLKIEIKEAKKNPNFLGDLVLNQEEVIITENEQPLLKIVPYNTRKKRRQSGSAKGLITMSQDFDEPLEEFEDYWQ